MAHLQTNPLALAALATAAVPRLDVVGAQMDHIGPDYAFAHAEDASGRIWVVRLALHAAAEAGQEPEIALLGSLAGASSGGALPFEVPRPRGSAELAGGGKAIVYAALPGVPVVMELMDPGPGIAESLGRAIGAFHELPPSIVTDAGLPAYTPSEYRTRLITEVDDAARTGHVSERLERRWRGQLDRDAWWVFVPVPIHGDMAAEHLMEHGGRISAMTDFASVQVSDPAEDLAQLLAPLPPDVAGSIVGAYRRRRASLDDPHLEDRAAFLGEVAIIRWLRHGIDLDDQAIINDARNMLADLDQAVSEEEAQEAREAAAEAEAHERLEAAKRAAEDEARQRREAVKRASEAAAREHVRTSGSIPRIRDHDDPVPGSAEDSGDLAVPGDAKSLDDLDDRDELSRPDDSAVLDDPPPPPAPKRLSVAGGAGVSLWGRPKKAPSTPVDAFGIDSLEADSSGIGGLEANTGTDARTVATATATATDQALPDEEADAPGSAQPEATGAMPGASEPDGLEPDSDEMTQVFLPDFLKDDSEAPADIIAAAAADETEALERPANPDRLDD